MIVYKLSSTVERDDELVVEAPVFGVTTLLFKVVVGVACVMDAVVGVVALLSVTAFTVVVVLAMVVVEGVVVEVLVVTPVVTSTKRESENEVSVSREENELCVITMHE